MRDAYFRWRRARVSGPSMVPTLRDGDTVIVRHGERIVPGDLVLATFRALPGRLVVKRAVRAVDGGWELASDNPFAGGGSAVHGIADVHGRIVLIKSGRRVRLARRGRPVR